MGLFCQHEWEVLSKERLPPPVEAYKAAITFQESPAGVIEQRRHLEAPLSACRSTLVQIVACKKCGKLHHFRDTA